MRLQFPGLWQNAVWLSCVIHFAVVVAVGAIASGMAIAEVSPPEKLIAVDLSVETPHLSSAAASAEPDSENALEDDAALQEDASPQSEDLGPAERHVEFAQSGAVSSAIHAKKRRGADGGHHASFGQGQARGRAAGSSAAAAAEAAPAGASGADRHAAINQFVSLVECNKKYPYMALKRGQTGTASVHVRLGAGGDLHAAEISESSGVKSLDDAALDAVRRACPFRHGLGEPLNMVVPVNYQLAG